MRDSPPEVQIVKNRLINTLRRIFELYGFSPFDTPAIETYELLAAKYAGGSEILKEIFTLRDRGNRQLALRYDLTVPLARFIALNPQLKLPFKRYQISKVWRDGPVGPGRYKEFWQCDVDIVGSGSFLADAEILMLANDVFRELGLSVEIYLNNIKLLRGILKAFRIESIDAAMIVLDKRNKLSKKELQKEFQEINVEKNLALKLLSFFDNISSNPLSSIKSLSQNKELIAGLNELKIIFDYLKQTNVAFKFEPNLARGLSYYTATIFEVFLKQSEKKLSLAGGGRYDRIIGLYSGSEQDVPAVGISFGLDRIADVLGKSNKRSPTQLLIVGIGNAASAFQLASKIRANGICCETSLFEKGVSKALSYADSLGIPFVAFYGEKEKQAGKIKLRNMKTGEESLVKLNELVKILISQHED